MIPTEIGTAEVWYSLRAFLFHQWPLIVLLIAHAVVIVWSMRSAVSRVERAVHRSTCGMREMFRDDGRTGR